MFNCSLVIISGVPLGLSASVVWLYKTLIGSISRTFLAAPRGKRVPRSKLNFCTASKKITPAKFKRYIILQCRTARFAPLCMYSVSWVCRWSLRLTPNGSDHETKNLRAIWFDQDPTTITSMIIGWNCADRNFPEYRLMVPLLRSSGV